MFYDDKDRPNRYLLAKEQISRPTAEDLEVCCSPITTYIKLQIVVIHPSEVSIVQLKRCTTAKFYAADFFSTEILKFHGLFLFISFP